MSDNNETLTNVNTNQQNTTISKPKKYPNFFIDKNQIEIEIFVVYNTLDGTILSVSQVKIDSSLIDGIEQISYKFIFTKPNYEQMSRYRQMSMYWDNIANKNLVNPFKLRTFLILNHLKRWENVIDEFGNKVELKIDIDNTLTQESLDKVYTVNASIMDKVMTELENKLNL